MTTQEYSEILLSYPNLINIIYLFDLIGTTNGAGFCLCTSGGRKYDSAKAYIITGEI